MRYLVLCWTDGIRHLGYADPSVCRRRSSYRARSGLQIVSGILHLQSAHVQSAEANEALQKASARVLAIAGVHGRLYTGKSIRSVPLGHLHAEIKKGPPNTAHNWRDARPRATRRGCNRRPQERSWRHQKLQVVVAASWCSPSHDTTASTIYASTRLKVDRTAWRCCWRSRPHRWPLPPRRGSSNAF